MAYVYCDNDLKTLKTLLPITNCNSLKAIWLKPYKYFFNQLEFSCIINSFSPMVCLLSYISSGSGGSIRIRDYKRAFGDWRTLSNNIISKADINNIERGNILKYYSDICLVDNSCINDIESFYIDHHQSFGIRTTITFLPNINNLLIKDCKMQYLEKFFFERYKEPFPIEEKIQTMATYVKCTFENGGVAGLFGSDCDTRVIFIFVGKNKVLEPIIAKIISDINFKQIGITEFQQWLNYGVDLKL